MAGNKGCVKLKNMLRIKQTEFSVHRPSDKVSLFLLKNACVTNANQILNWTCYLSVVIM